MAVDISLAQEAASLLQGLIRIDTSNPGRPEGPAARLLAEFFERHGIEAHTLEPEPGRTSVAARVSGTTPDAPALLLLSHLDTVPVSGSEQWSHSPFSGDAIDGFIWGRGALDDKGRTAVNAAALVALAQKPAPGDVLFVAAADEEEAGENGVQWLRQTHPEVLSAPYALGEGGGFRSSLGQKDFYTYAVSEKGAFRAHLRLRSGGTGHASVPGGTDLVRVAAKAATQLGSLSWPWTPTKAAKAMLRELTRGQPLTRQLGLQALASRPLGPVLLKSGLGLSPTQHEALQAMFHTTVAITTLSAGQGVSILPDEAEIDLSVRYLRPQDRDEAVRRIRHVLAKLSIQPEMTIDKEARVRSAPIESPLVAAMREAMASLDPGVSLVPTLLPASSDLRDLEEGTVAYGFTPMRGISADEVARLVHGRDERMAIDDIAFGIEATVETARRLRR